MDEEVSKKGGEIGIFFILTKQSSSSQKHGKQIPEFAYTRLTGVFSMD